MLAGMWGNRNTHSLLVSQNWYNHNKIKVEAPPKERNKYNTNPGIPPLSIHSKSIHFATQIPVSLYLLPLY